MNFSTSSDAPLKVFLLQQQPGVILDGTELRFERQQPLDLFIYLAENSRSEYTRSELLVALYGDSGNPDNFRKGAIFYLPDTLKGQYVDTSDPTVVQFRRDEVWVDSSEFTQRANALLNQSPLAEPDQIEEAKAILGLYGSHFLESYNSKADGFVEWREAKQAQLAALRHRLFDQMIQFYLWHAALADAQQVAEQWLTSLDSGQTPLQYLIWITAQRQRHAQLDTYLEMLRKKEEKEGNTSAIGMSAHEWRQQLQSKSPLSLLQLRMTTHPNRPTFASINQSDILGQDEVLHEILAVFSQNTGTKILALTGLPGAGKTTLAQLVTTLQMPNSGYEIIFVQLSAEPDFETILNDILVQIRMSHATPLTLVKKQRYVKQFLQRRRCLVVVDEGNTRKLGDSTIFQSILNMLSGASILFAAQRIPDENYPSIAVDGLKPYYVKQLLTRELPDLDTLSDEHFENLARITGGLPMGLNLIAGFLKEERFRPKALINDLIRKIEGPVDEGSVYSTYDIILLWLWQTLTQSERLIVHAVSLFDSTNGATAEDIALVCKGLDSNRLKDKIDTLCRLSLLRAQKRPDTTERYSLHSIIHRFVREIASKSSTPAADIESLGRAYIEYFLAYVDSRYTQFPRLDEQRENIIHMFELVLLGEQHSEMLGQTIRMLCLMYPYFEKRGLYGVASRLILSARQQAEKLGVTREYVQLLQFAGEAAIRQSAFEVAEEYCKQAIDFAKQINASDLYGEIYLDYGMAHIQKAEYAAAMDFFKEANRWAMQHEQLRLLCRIAANSGVCVYRQGFHEESKCYYGLVLEYVADQNLRDLPIDLKDIVQFSLTGLGLVAADEWDYVRADRYYQQAMELARQVNNPERIGYLYINLGVASFFTRAYDAAQEYFLQAKLIADYIQHDELATLVTHNQGALNSAQHRYEEAEALLKTALIQALEIGLPWLQTRIYIALGKLYLRQGINQKANLCFLKALKTSDQSARFHTLAFYGLSLVELSSNDLVGLDDPEGAPERIAAMLVRFEIDHNLLRKLSRPDLEHAHKFFQHDLDGFPQMNRFRIVEGLLACASEEKVSLE